jgi:cyclophilin family peptidyl-prolyl cis-trans isomerase
MNTGPLSDDAPKAARAQYKLVTETSESTFERNVNSLLAQGYNFRGKLIVTTKKYETRFTVEMFKLNLDH